MWPSLALTLLAGAAPVFVNKAPSTPPAIRRSSDAAIRPTAAGEELLIYGGFNGATLNDLESYTAGMNTWAPRSTIGVIPARERHAMAWDPLHSVGVIIGGASGLTVFENVYLVSNSFTVTAPPLTGTRPAARVDAALHWAPSLGKFVYYGGGANVFGTTHLGDLWTLDVSDGGVNWQQVVPVGGAPTARGAVCSAWDPDQNWLLMFGGETNGPANSAEVWKFDFDAGAWSMPVTTGAGPTARSFCGADWDPNIKQLVVYGGQTSNPTGGLFSFNPLTNAWTTYAPAVNPGNLSDSAVAYSGVEKGILFFGGRSAGSTYTNATWLLRFNNAPTADAGPDLVVNEGALQTLSGSVFDPEGDAVTSSWAQTQGPVVTLAGPLLTPSFTAPAVTANTVLRFVLTANDGFSSSTDDVLVTVLNSINEPPIADAGPDLVADGGALVTLLGSGSDPNGSVVTFGWSQVAGAAVTLSAPAAAMPTFTAPSLPMTTVLSFRLVVNDGMAASAPDDVFVTVNATPGIDAGADGGALDGGALDGGALDGGALDGGALDGGALDGGALDGGALDGGALDAGAGTEGDGGASDGGNRGTPRVLTVSCDCTQGPGALGWLAALSFLATRRRRRS